MRFFVNFIAAVYCFLLQARRKIGYRRRRAKKPMPPRAGSMGLNRDWPARQPVPDYFAVGITNSAPLPMLSGQRCMMDFCLV
jgi:hypothetical protein